MSTSDTIDGFEDGPAEVPAGAAVSGVEAPHRRSVLKALAALGVGTLTFRRALAAQAGDAGKVTAAMIQQAEWIAGLDLSDQEREDTARAVRRSLDSFESLRKVEVGFDVPPALAFVPAPGLRPAEGVRRN